MKKIICLTVVTLFINNAYAIDNGYTGGEPQGSSDYLTAALMLVLHSLTPKEHPRNIVTDNTKLGKEKPFSFESKD